MENQVRNRTLRRRQRNDIIKDYATDLDTIERLQAQAITPKQVAAYDVLHKIVYSAYIEVLSSEV